MNYTPKYKKNNQLKIWLSKTPAERLKQFLEDNEALFKFWQQAKEMDKSIIKE